MAMVFGWLPAFLWVVIGGVFFGAVQDFGALYASVKSEAVSQWVRSSKNTLVELVRNYSSALLLGLHINRYCCIRRYGWAGTFNGLVLEGAKLAPNASAASISILYVFVAMAFGLLLRKVNFEGWPKVVLGIVLIVAMLAVVSNSLYMQLKLLGFI